MLILSCVIGLLLSACGSSRPTSGQEAADRTPTSQAVGAARAFLSRYMTDGGRIQRTDQGGDTVGEGQAYGMLAAAAIGDRGRFGQIWSWTQRNMINSDGLLAFHWANGHVVDPTAAADADLDTTRALLVGACRFHEPSLRTAAIRIGRAILAHETARAGSLDVLIAGPWANKGSYVVFDPSYVDPTSLMALARVTGDQQFRALAVDGTTLVNSLTRPLPPDWATVNTRTGAVTAVSGPTATAGPGMFTYDAPRTLVRMGADASVAGRQAVARAWGVFSTTRPADIVTEHQLSGAAVGDAHNPVTLVAAAGAAKAAGDRGAVMKLLNEAERLNARTPTYYGGAWVALGRLMLTTSLLGPCGR